MTKRDLIARRARAMGLDPSAVLAVASVEGLSGRVGDQGTSFGPFQLHWGGAMPKKYSGNKKASHQFAWSRAGIDYALRGMVNAGARGQRGKRAVSTIVSKFERPADIPGEISKAWGLYGKVGAGGPVPEMGSAVERAGRVFDRAGFQQHLAQGLMAASQAAVSGDIAGHSAALGGLAQAKQSFMSEVEAQHTGGTTVGNMDLPDGAARDIIAAARKQIGQPYVWGGESRKEGGFDCSGLIQWAYAQKGMKIPRTTTTQKAAGKKVAWGKFKPGDLIFANSDKHVVMYVGGGKVIAAPHRGAVVRYQPLSDFASSFSGARRYL